MLADGFVEHYPKTRNMVDILAFSGRVPMSRGVTLIFTIAFEGMNRAGKGTQIALLQHWLHTHHFPVVTLRGDGSRDGLGLSMGDPHCREWRSFKRRLALCAPDQRFSMWNKAACRLALEFVEWKTLKLLPLLERLQSDFGFILLDRSLISRLLLRYDETGKVSLETCYPLDYKGKTVTWQDVLPTTTFLLHAPQQVLLDRLSQSDPKHEFRQKMLKEKYPLFEDVLNQLPEPINSTCIRVNSTSPINEIHAICLDHVQRLLVSGHPTC
jgi:thymidylate kinase